MAIGAGGGMTPAEMLREAAEMLDAGASPSEIEDLQAGICAVLEGIVQDGGEWSLTGEAKRLCQRSAFSPADLRVRFLETRTVLALAGEALRHEGAGQVV